MNASHLSRQSREAAISALKRSRQAGGGPTGSEPTGQASAGTHGRPDGEPLDVLVIGGGVTGAGTALDAASRGLRVGLVEAEDWASGTSSRSSKLLHGGLRYLEMLDFALVHEALTERDVLLTRLAPHLVEPIAFLHPLRRPIWDRFYYGTGIALYDLLATLRRMPRVMPWHRHVSRRELHHAFPEFRGDAAVGAIQYWDARVDDARLVTSLVRTAAAQGSHVASRVQVTGLHTDAAGRVDGAMLVDLESGEHFEVRAKQVISATGVWTEATQAMAAPGGLRVLASKGIHVVVPKERLTGERGLILRTAKSVLFVIPWSRYWIIGTTDTPWTEDLHHPVPTAADIDYVLAEANRVLRTPLTREDVVGSYAGLRPLLLPEVKAGTKSAKVSREHTVASPVPGLVSIAGGKLTTYRVMAKDAVDFALGAEAARRPSRTETLRLVGAELRPSVAERLPAGRTMGLRETARFTRDFVTTHGLEDRFTRHLLRRYGNNIAELAQIVAEIPEAARPLGAASAYLRAEIIYAIRAEGALHLDDLMDRRTRIRFEYPNQGLDAVVEIAAIAAQELGWSAEREREEVAAYRAMVIAYAQAITQPDDAAAAKADAHRGDQSQTRVGSTEPGW
ncbi:glycerol-3-phosphate dehydrogenase/oxidase [Gulosibacter chungangensis]|uniref:Glycerol-3-phosphate dehydrogenase n=1 Tax=Gulosibacter chungangensis TaxID=979746 RepID=A0A7J5BFW6_9MICO|nr:glycerol-3-phosphate dehydrogenase/oxidase [Gulosibacter chungangensis]KAB1645173.1 glycerol-3-phosphate dehydrogenase/oxidase [Gulosibacter chungangensis]